MHGPEWAPNGVWLRLLISGFGVRVPDGAPDIWVMTCGSVRPLRVVHAVMLVLAEGSLVQTLDQRTDLVTTHAASGRSGASGRTLVRRDQPSQT